MAKAHQEKPGTLTSATILAGATIPVHIAFKVRLTTKHPTHPGQSQFAALERRMRPHERKILHWLGSSRSNAALLLMDPITAMKEAGVKLEPELLASLKRIHAKNAKQDVLPAGAKIVAFEASVSEKVSESGPSGTSHRTRSPEEVASVAKRPPHKKPPTPRGRK